MIGLLQGTIYDKNATNMLILVNGVGYLVEAVTSLSQQTQGEEITAYIYTHVREDAIKLFGFSSEEELKVFEMLLNVSGIGPKGAMSIISTLGVTEIYQAINTQNVKSFKGVSGIGTKNAEKIIIELKSKVKKLSEDRIDLTGDSHIHSIKTELESALLSLGYSLSEIKYIEPNIDYTQPMAVMIRLALQLLNKAY